MNTHQTLLLTLNPTWTQHINCLDFYFGYKVVCKDCSVSGGRAFLCICETLPVIEPPLLLMDAAEAVWAKLALSLIYIILFIYRPSNTDDTQLT